MTAPSANETPLRRCGDTWLCFLAALAFYLALPQAALHGTDWRWLVLWTQEPGAVHPQHPGYLFLAKLACWATQSLNVPTTAVLSMLSALGAAIAVAMSQRVVWLWRCDRALANTAALLVATTPALFHFATVIEMHAPFAAVMSCALWAMVPWLRAPRWSWAVRCGALTGAATLVHATGHVLVPALALLALWQMRPTRNALAQVAAMASTHALVWAAGYAILRALGHLPTSVAGFVAAPDDVAASSNPLDYLMRWLVGLDLWRESGPTLVREWLQSYAPWSLAVILGLVTQRLRAATTLLLIVLLGYLLVAVTLVHAITDERGAYLLPLALPSVLIVLLSVPRRAWPLLAVVGITCGFWQRGEPGRLPPDLAFGRAAAAFAAQQPTVFFVADLEQMDGAHLANPRLELILARKELADLAAAMTVAPSAAQIAGWLGLKRADAAAEGAQLVVPTVTLHWLESRLPTFAAGWQQFAAAAVVVPMPAQAGITGYLVR